MHPAGDQHGAEGPRAPGADLPEAQGGAPRTTPYTWVERALVALCLVLFIAMIGATLAQILFRYVLEISVVWTEEAARTLFVLSMVMAIAFAYREREHIIVDFIFGELPASAQRWLGLAFNLFILAFLAFWARGALQLAELNWGSNLVTIPFFRVAYFYYWELAAIALLFLYVLLDTVARARGNREALATGQDMDA
ncbi:TRAP transporter small permease [Acuticoccus sp.]|uniref:TRAP transporter small permease n=1 Tax=Acuticoccus sp. TaxID=1904378 RepID=UPI003B5224EB